MKKAERLERVRQMLLKNVRQKDIAIELGVSESKISVDVKEIMSKDTSNEYIHAKIREMFASGKSIAEISFILDISKTYVSAVVKKSDVKKKYNVVAKKNLIDENTVFADNSVNLEKLVVDGKKYLDITQALAPR